MYEIIDEASDAAGRSRLTIGPVSELFPFDVGANIFAYHVSLNATASGPMPLADFITGQGHGVDSNLEHLSSLPDGRWLTYIYPTHAVQLTQASVDFGHGEMGQTPIVYNVGDSASPPLQVSPPWAENLRWQNVNLEMGITNGAISAVLSFDYINPKLDAARGQTEYDFAAVEMTQIIGHAVKTATGGVIVAQGAGRIVARTDEGSEHIYPAWFDIVSARVPDTLSDEALQAILADG